MYDIAGSVLRVETTIGRTADFKVFRPPHNDPRGKLDWVPSLILWKLGLARR